MKTNLTLLATVLVILNAFAQNDFNTKPWENKKYPIIIDPYRRNKIDFDKLITDKNVMGNIHKASEGLIMDSEYKNRSIKSKEKNLLFASYHLGDNSDPIQQADFYLNTIKDNINQPMALDIEDYEQDPKQTKSPFIELINAEKFINRIYEKTKRYPIVYVNNKVFDRINKEYDKNSVFAKCQLWYARYKTSLPTLSTKVWDKVSLWQFSSEINCKKTGSCLYNIPGTEYDIDINVFNGDSEELKLFWNNNQPKVDQPKVEQPKVEQPKVEQPKEQQPIQTNNGQAIKQATGQAIQQINGKSKQSKKDKLSQPTLVAVYDYEKQIYLNDELRPKHKQPVVLKIISINKFAHNVLITENDVKIKDEYLDTDLETARTILDQSKPVAEITSETTSMQVDVPKSLVEASSTAADNGNTNIEKLQTSINAKKSELQNIKNETERKKNRACKT
ncbi:glycoside hydrolase family 25 protein [Flavobacterium sp.]|uniref:glycoside hydrolase family 25 protein n=1 Tax=Flavobacterium sp. TaxID=239 RepID=UPI00286E587D|nr:glycoside hydrolase family 25 protein [Flavobacterium sp.]